MTKTVEELIEEAAVRVVRERDENCNAAFASVYNNGYMYVTPNGGCHYNLGNSGNPRGGSRVAVVSSLQRPNYRKLIPIEAQIVWLNYLFNESIYSEYFFSKDPKKALEDTWVAISADAPSNLMASGLVSTRHLWEKRECVVLFHALREAGVNPDIAFVISVGNKVLGGGYPTTQDRAMVSMRPKVEGHMPFTPQQFSLRCLKNFLDRTPPRLNKPYSETCSYSGLDYMFLTTGAHNTTPLYTYLESNYRYGAQPTGSDMFNIFINVVKGVHTDPQKVKYDPLDLFVEKFSKDICPQLEEEVKKL